MMSATKRFLEDISEHVSAILDIPYDEAVDIVMEYANAHEGSGFDIKADDVAQEYLSKKKKIVLDEEDEDFPKIKEEWFTQARNIKDTKELTAFIDHLFNDYAHDYGTVVHAITASVLATAWMGASIEGITGFQASCITWIFIKNWSYPNNKTGLGIINFDNMLYPQYEKQFSKKISSSIWEALQKEAKNRLETSSDYSHPDVVTHWQSIVDGVVPFGYEVDLEDE